MWGPRRAIWFMTPYAYAWEFPDETVDLVLLSAPTRSWVVRIYVDVHKYARIDVRT